MKKIILSFLLFALVISANAQFTSPRFGTSKNQNQTLAPMTASYAAPAYAATYAVTPNAFDTYIVMGTLTGAQTITAVNTFCYAGDKLTILFTADVTGRTVTLSTGLNFSAATIVIPGSKKASVTFTFDGAVWIETGRAICL